MIFFVVDRSYYCYCWFGSRCKNGNGYGGRWKDETHGGVDVVIVSYRIVPYCSNLRRFVVVVAPRGFVRVVIANFAFLRRVPNFGDKFKNFLHKLNINF